MVSKLLSHYVAKAVSRKGRRQQGRKLGQRKAGVYKYDARPVNTSKSKYTRDTGGLGKQLESLRRQTQQQQRQVAEERKRTNKALKQAEMLKVITKDRDEMVRTNRQLLKNSRAKVVAEDQFQQKMDTEKFKAQEKTRQNLDTLEAKHAKSMAKLEKQYMEHQDKIQERLEKEQLKGTASMENLKEKNRAELEKLKTKIEEDKQKRKEKDDKKTKEQQDKMEEDKERKLDNKKELDKLYKAFSNLQDIVKDQKKKDKQEQKMDIDSAKSQHSNEMKTVLKRIEELEKGKNKQVIAQQQVLESVKQLHERDDYDKLQETLHNLTGKISGTDMRLQNHIGNSNEFMSRNNDVTANIQRMVNKGGADMMGKLHGINKILASLENNNMNMQDMEEIREQLTNMKSGVMGKLEGLVDTHQVSLEGFKKLMIEWDKHKQESQPIGFQEKERLEYQKRQAIEANPTPTDAPPVPEAPAETKTETTDNNTTGTPEEKAKVDTATDIPSDTEDTYTIKRKAMDRSMSDVYSIFQKRRNMKTKEGIYDDQMMDTMQEGRDKDAADDNPFKDSTRRIKFQPPDGPLTFNLSNEKSPNLESHIQGKQ